MNTLKAEKRGMDIKAKKLRREGFVTGNVFGKELPASIPLKMLKKDVDHLLKETGKGGQVILDVDGSKMNVLIKDIAFNPLKNQIDEMDFQALVQGEKVHSVSEIVLLNHDKVSGGIVEQMLQEIAYRALPADLTEKITIDLSGYHIGDTVKVKDLDFAKNANVDISTDPETIVFSIAEPHASVEETEAESDGSAENEK